MEQPSRKTQKRIRREDASAVCEMIARGEVTQTNGAKLLGVGASTMRYWLLKLGYRPDREGNGTRNKQWSKVAAPVSGLSANWTSDMRERTNTRRPLQVMDSAPQDEDELDTEQRLRKAAALLADAASRLARLAQVEQELAALKEKHAYFATAIEQQRTEIDELRADAEYGRKQRKIQKQVQLRETTKMFDERLLEVSQHLHRPK